MSDDPNKKHEDGWFVSSQPHEYSYFLTNMVARHPQKTKDQVAQAILQCRKEIKPSEGRKKLEECVANKLG